MTTRRESNIAFGTGPIGPDGERACWQGETPWGPLHLSWNRGSCAGVAWGPGFPTVEVRAKPGWPLSGGGALGFDAMPRDGLLLQVGDASGEVQQPGTRSWIGGFVNSLRREGLTLTAQAGGDQWRFRAVGYRRLELTRDGRSVVSAICRRPVRLDLEPDGTPADLALAGVLAQTLGWRLFPSNSIV